MYIPDHTQHQFDDGYMALFKTDNRYGDSVVRLFCEHNRHFQWVRWGTAVKTDPAGGDTNVVNLAEDEEDTGQAEDAGEAKEAGNAEDTGDAEEEGEARCTGEAKEEGIPKEAGKPKETGDAEDDVVDAEVIESGEEEEWGETHEEGRVQVAGVELVISGPHDPEIVIDGALGTASET